MWLVKPGPITVMGERVDNSDVAGKEKQRKEKQKEKRRIRHL